MSSKFKSGCVEIAFLSVIYTCIYEKAKVLRSSYCLLSMLVLDLVSLVGICSLIVGKTVGCFGRVDGIEI